MAQTPALRFFCPSCGGDALESLDNKLFGCARCGYTYFHNTAVSVSAVIEHAGDVAWVTRAHEPGFGFLDLPGGFVEPDEALEEAVLREVLEETGFASHSPSYLFSIPNRYEYHGMHYSTVAVFFACSVEDRGCFVPNAEASALNWIALRNVDPARLAFDSTRAALRRLVGRPPPPSTAS